MTSTAGELEKLGLEEVEPGFVADTPENRLRIYKLDGHWQFERDLDEDGVPTGLIRPVPLEVLTRRREKNWDVYKPLLVDPDDPWSDYVGPDEFPLDAYAPQWVLHRLAVWHRKEREGIPEEDRERFPIRCTWRRVDGTRCWLWVGRPEVDVCTPHLKRDQQDKSQQLKVAKIKLLEMSPYAVENLERLAYTAEGEAVRLKATTEILDRAGVRGGTELEVSGEVTHHDASASIRDKLARLSERLATERARLSELQEPDDVVDGEVVEDEDGTGRAGDHPASDRGVAGVEGRSASEVEVADDDT